MKIPLWLSVLFLALFALIVCAVTLYDARPLLAGLWNGVSMNLNTAITIIVVIVSLMVISVPVSAAYVRRRYPVVCRICLQRDGTVSRNARDAETCGECGEPLREGL
jgi:hypothetical protein